MAQATEWKTAGVTGETPTWDEGDNKVLEGIFVQLKTRVGVNKSDVYVIKTADGKLKNVWETAVLRTAFADIPEGSEVRIEFMGMKQSPDQIDEKTGELAMYRDFYVQYREPQA